MVYNRDTGDECEPLVWNADEEDRRCIAWNPASTGRLMFATGSRNEGVKIWLALPRSDAPNPSRRSAVMSMLRPRSTIVTTDSLASP